MLECVPCGDAFNVLLDRSAFYPTSGGQPFDIGTLGGVRVIDVNVNDGNVWHTVEAPLEPGTTVCGKIDWARRFDHMQQHAADHMIAGALYRIMNGVTIGLHVSDEISTIDVAMPEGVTRISPEEIRRIETDVNEHIQRNVSIRCWFPEADELEQLPLRKKPTVSEHVRFVAIGDDEMVACGGTHPRTAGEIGMVKIVSATPARGKMRVAFLAGMRALKNYRHCYDTVHAAAELFSTSTENLAPSIAAMQERLHNAETELARIRREQLLSQSDDMLSRAEALPGGARLVARMIDADAGLVRDLASKLIEQSGVVALLGAKNGAQAAYVFGRSKVVDVNMGALLREAAKPFGGKGGGRPDFAQGGGCAEILDAACRVLKGDKA